MLLLMDDALNSGALDLLTQIIIILVLFFGNWLKKNRINIIEKLTKKSVIENKNNLNTNKDIQKELIELRLETGADRVMVYQFHNGDYYIDNSSILKMSVTFEHTNTNIVSIMNDLQGMLVSKYPNFLVDLLDKSYLEIKDVNEDYDRYEIAKELTYRQVESFYAIKLINASGKFIGFITLCYLDKNNTKDFIETEFINYARRVTFLLDKKVK